MNKCDIIIPIYNAYDCVKECIESIIKNTDFKNCSLILIDDKSTDKNILPLLKEYEKKYNFIILLENKINVGFVGTVNRGMKYSKNDVLLLNSDTEVSKNWLKNIQECAYSQDNIATVSPLSNNATTNSVPIGLQKNLLPDNMTFDEYASLIEKCSYNEYPELPTGHGFCLYIKREVINKIGYFDEKAFEKGYGEENDFCFRALDYGYKNILCDNVIVYHKESQSFSTSKKELIEEHLKILSSRYPNYKQKSEIWCSKCPIMHICKNIFYNISMYNRKNILIIIHDYKNIKENLGGTSLHVYDLINGLRDKYNFHVLTPESGCYKLYSIFENKEETINFPMVNSYNTFSFYNEDYKKMIDKIIDAFGIELIHIHHLIGHYFDIMNVAIEKGIPYVFTAHDFYSICPSINLLYKNENYCYGGNENMCSECLKYKYDINNYIIPTWRNEWNKFLTSSKKVFFPSKTAEQLLKERYKIVNAKVIGHGIKLKKNSNILTREISNNIGFLGVMTKHKGIDVLESLLKNKSINLNYYLFGTAEVDSLKKSRQNYKYVGKYNRNNLNELLTNNKIDLICLFSICPETFSYTLEEAISCGIPVVSFNIGAISERIEKYGLGWTIPLTNNSKEVEKELLKILDNKKDYNTKLENIKNYKIKTIKKMCDEYNIEYSNLLKKKTYSMEKMKEIIKSNFKVNDNIDSVQLQWILNSRKWKIVSKIKVPNIIKKIIK